MCGATRCVFRCSAPCTAWRSMAVLTPTQGRRERDRARKEREREGINERMGGKHRAGQRGQSRMKKNEQTLRKGGEDLIPPPLPNLLSHPSKNHFIFITLLLSISIFLSHSILEVTIVIFRFFILSLLSFPLAG